MFEIGNTLREARLRRGLDISDCESSTKIRAKYLRALEEEQFEVLPGPTYVKGFLKTYADHLELDGRLVLDEYESRYLGRGDQHTDPDYVKRRLKRRRGREGRVLVIASTLVLLSALGLWVGFGGEETVTRQPTLEIGFTGAGTRETYLEVRQNGQEGKPLFTPGFIAPTELRTLKATPPVWVHIGNGSGIRLTVDGRPKDTPAGKLDFTVEADGTLRPIER